MSRHNLDDTIAAISTPVGEGGIAIVRLSGPRALKIADKIFASKDGKKASEFGTYTVHYGHIVDKGKIIDEVILTVMRAPKSYTREDIVEINCHGGIQAAKKTLELAVKDDVRLAEPGEFTKRAFLNGRIDLAQAEAVLDVICSKTEGSLKIAASQLEGGLSKEVNSIRDRIVDIASQVEGSIDFPEEDIEPRQKKDLVESSGYVAGCLKGLLDTYDGGMVMREGVLAIICGKPNVGKSSLMNLLLKRDRVIVSPTPGTTRDAVEEFINLRGIPIRLVDTAGIIETKNALDKESARRSKLYLKMADIALLVLDGSSRMERADLDIIKLLGKKKKLVVINKIDLPRKIGNEELQGLFKDDKIIELSVKKRKNITLLEKVVSDMIYSGAFIQGECAIVSNARHKALLDKSYRSMLKVLKALDKDTGFELVSLDLKDAIFNLGLIVGKSVSDDILNEIFEKFCIGK